MITFRILDADPSRGMAVLVNAALVLRVSDIIEPILLDIPDRIETERLTLRAPRSGDGAIVFPGIEESRDELRPWMPWAVDAYDRAAAELWCRKSAGQFLLREQLQFLILTRGANRYLGSLGLFKFNWKIPSCELGYWLRTSEHRHGYMTDAVRGLTEMAVQTLKMARIEIRCDVRNTKSSAVALRAGYHVDGTFKNDSRGTDGELRSTHIYSRTA